MANFPKLRYIMVFFVASLVACATPPKTVPDLGSAVAEFPAMSLGDTWVVLEHDNKYGTVKTTNTVTSVESDGSFDIRKENDKNSHAGFKHFDSKAAGVDMILGVQFDPGALQFPLFVGKAWETKADAESTDGDYYTYKSKYVVEEYTTVKTEVGIFEAFRIKANINNPSTNWRGTSNYWYAPAAKAIVKSTNSHIRGVKLLKMDLVE